MGRNKKPPREACQVRHHKYRFALLHNMTDELVYAGLQQSLDFSDCSPRLILLALLVGCGTNTNCDLVAG